MINCVMLHYTAIILLMTSLTLAIPKGATGHTDGNNTDKRNLSNFFCPDYRTLRDCIPCNEKSKGGYISGSSGEVRPTQVDEMYCCGRMFKNFPIDGDDSNISWISNSSFQQDPSCPQRAVTRGLKESDKLSSVTCVITTSTGEVFNFTRVLSFPGIDLPNSATVTLETTSVVVNLGERGTRLECNAGRICHDGEVGNYSMQWAKIDGHSSTILDGVDGFNVTRKINFSRSNALTITLDIEEITSSVVGTYTCLLTYIPLNMTTSKNTTVTLEVPKVTTSFVIIIVTVSLCVLVCVGFVIYFREWMKLYVRSRCVIASNRKGTHDFFVIHGDESSDWVMEVLLTTLGEQHGYSGIIKDYAFLGGEDTAIMAERFIEDSHLVILVESKCEGDRPAWGGKAVFVAIRNIQANLLRIELPGSNQIKQEYHYDYNCMKAVKKITWPGFNQRNNSNETKNNKQNITYDENIKVVPEAQEYYYNESKSNSEEFWKEILKRLPALTHEEP